MDNQHLDDSLRRFTQKKAECLAFVDLIDNTLADLRQFFPKAFNQDMNLDAVRQKIQDSRLKILFAGQFKTGKSTAVNALLGEEVLPAYSIPCTAVITEVLYGQDKQATLSFRENIAEIPAGTYPKAAEHIRKHQGHQVPDLEIQIRGNELENYLAIPESDAFKEQEESVAESPYAACRLYWPLELCKNGAVIIDSPGLNEARARDETTLKYVPQADIIIHVLNALQFYGKPDEQFIQELERMGETPVLFLINRFDQVQSDRERERLRNYALNKLLPHSTYGKSCIFFVSAQQALEGRSKQDTAKLEQSGLVDFEKAVARILDQKYLGIKFASLRSVCSHVETIVHDSLPGIKKMLDNSAQELETQYSNNQQAFQNLEEGRQEIVARMQQRLARCRQDVNAAVALFLLQLEDRLRNDIVNTPLPEIGVFSANEDIAQCGQVIRDVCQSTVQEQLAGWIDTTCQNIVQDTVQRMQADSEYLLQQFKNQLSSLRQEFQMDPLSNEARRIETCIIDAFLIVFEKLFTQDIYLTAIKAIYYIFINHLENPIRNIFKAFFDKLLSRETLHEEIRRRYILLISNLQQNREILTAKIGSLVMEKLEEGLGEISRSLSSEVDRLKQSIEEALHQLQGDQEDLEISRARLDTFARKLARLDEAGQSLLKSLTNC